MKIYIVSDTHGKTDVATEIYRNLKDIDLIIHLGDNLSDGKRMEKELGVSVLAVKGNMDGAFSHNGYQILETDYGKIYIAHGHMESVKSSPQNILYRAEELGCVAAFYGHTHVPIFRQVEGIYLLNPGSISLPAGGRQGSYAIANIEKDSLTATIFYVEGDAVKEKSRKQGGFLKDMLNNSDRF